MDTKLVSQSVDGATKALKSSLTEGSTKLFGSMRDAKRGFLGGLSSTFDHVVNIVGGPEDGAAGGAQKPDSTSGDASAKTDNRPPFKRRNTNPFMEGYDPNIVEAEIPPPVTTTTDGGATVVPAYHSVEPSRAWDNSAGSGTAADGYPRIPSGATSAFTVPAAESRRRRGSDSDADSEATEGCDERQDDIDIAEVSLQAADVRSGSGSSNAGQSTPIDNEDLSQLDPATRECIEFIKYIVNKIFDPSSEITPTDKAKFGETCQQGMGRLWFSKYITAQRVHNKQVAEQAILSLVQFFSVVLFECNEAEDYGPATTLMNMAFTFYHEVQDPKTQDANIFAKLWSKTQPKPKMYLYSYLTDQSIWQSPRFWNAAFFYAVQHERASKPTATSNTDKQEQIDDVRFQQNITFGQLRTFTSNMRALGVPKDQCLEFIRRQSTIANLTREQVKILRENMETWKDEASTK